ncbi:MAG TPA: hypothetical protein VF824_12865 [Thermoanaerobaculia bacterium]
MDYRRTIPLTGSKAAARLFYCYEVIEALLRKRALPFSATRRRRRFASGDWRARKRS